MTEGWGRPAGFEARHFDGHTAEPRPATASVDALGVRVVGADGAARIWPFGELTLMRGDARDEPVQLERRADPIEVLIVPDRAFLGLLRSAMPAGTRLVKSGGRSPSLRVVAALLLAAIALIAALYRFAIPALADFAAGHVPPEWERSYGAAVLSALAPEHERARDPRLLRPPREILRGLDAPGAVPAGGERLIVLRSEVPNAFAVPGGTVLVTTGLLRAVRSSDELAAVLAHEEGHVRRGHVMRAVVRRLSMGVLLGLVAGDQSALSGVVRTAGELGELTYSREYEREADDEALALLARLGVPPLALADALESITRGSSSALTLGFLSTHPAPEERRARIRAAAASRGTPGGESPWRLGAGWEEMKAALAETSR